MSDGMQCQQLVTIDSCCDPQPCPEAATMWQPSTGAALCGEHYANGEKYAIDGTWEVGVRKVSLPDGWTSLAPAEAPPTIEPVTAAPDATASSSGLVIESTALDESGLVLARTSPVSSESDANDFAGRAGDDDVDRSALGG